MQNKLKQGEALFAEGKIEGAEKCFLEILNEDPENKEACNNLGVIAFQQQNIEQAIQHLTRSLEIDPFYKNAVLNYCDVLRSLDLTHKAFPFLEKVVQKYPDDRELSQLLHEVRLEQRPRTKIAVLCLPGLQSFLGDIVDYLKTKYDVRTCYSNNNQEIESAVLWADVVWLEWANELTIHVVNNMPSISGKQVICRVHSYEVLQGYLPRVNWSRITKTIFVADHVVKIARDIYPAISQLTECVVVHNGVNLEKFQFKERKPGFNIAVVGSINHKKNPGMWVEVLSRLVQLDRRYILKVAGEFQELRYKYYMDSIVPKIGLTNNIKFYGHVDNIAKWFATNDINYLLTTSPFESFGYSIAEAMAMGYRPLIHAFPGAEDIWPADCIFRHTDELIRLVLDRQTYDSRKYRQYVTQKYSLQSQLQKIETIIEGILNRISGEASSATLRGETSVQPRQHIGIPTALAEYHRPEKNVIVTGIPRSGTSLFSVLLNTFENTICLNEILYDVDSLPRDFAEIRRRLIAGEPIPNRYDSSGNLSTDTQGGAVNVEKRVAKQVDGNVVIGSKVNIPYLNQIQKILNYSYEIIAIVRDPVYAIGSWNSKKASIIPEAHVTDDDMHPRWRGFSFASKDKIERQAQIWNFYAHLIWNLKDRIKIYTYELLTSDPEWVVQDMSKFLGLEPPRDIVELKNQNIDSKYPKIEQIKEAVRKYCPIKEVFGYGCRDYKGPTDSGTAAESSEEGYDPEDYWECRARSRVSPNSADPATTARHKDYLSRLIHKYQPHSLLEFGAGVGRLFTEYAGIKKLSFCDLSHSYQKEARRAANKLGLRGDFHLCAKVDVTPFEDKEFDIVVAVAVLLHQRPEEIESVMSELARIGHRVILISWYEERWPVDRITSDGHCYMHDYQGLCRRNGWEMQDIEYARRQIYCTYGSRRS